MSRTVIIGGGASGMMAAVCAAGSGEQVTMIEKNSVPGKKLLVTGNGRCNFTNTTCQPGHFFEEMEGFVQRALAAFSPQQAMEFFSRLGIYTREEDDGRVYPYTEQASSIRSALLYELARLRVRVAADSRAAFIRHDAGGFQVGVTPSGGAKSQTSLASQEIELLAAERVIVATGGKAGEQFGSTGDGYQIALAFGHQLIKPLPALVPLTAASTTLKEMKGLRVKGKVTLWINGEETISAEGEVQYTSRGLSGICVMDLSRIAARALERGDTCRLTVDLMPHISKKELSGQLQGRVNLFPQKKLRDFLNGLAKDKLQPEILRQAHMASDKPCRQLDALELSALAHTIKGLQYEITGYLGFGEAQVTTGGVSLREVSSGNMESKLVPGLHFCGEVLDVDGRCGGFNLQWAWTSGYLAGCNVRTDKWKANERDKKHSGEGFGRRSGRKQRRNY